MSGAPKLITLTTPAIRNQTTLIWLQKQSEQVNWSRWDSVVTSLADYQRWDDHNERIVGLVLTEVEDNLDTFLTTLFQISSQVQLVLLSPSILSLKSEEFWADNFDNVINLGDLESYPFVEPWEQTREDGVAVLGHLLRYHRLIDVPVSSTRLATLEPNITVVHNVVPAQTWVITQYFRHPQKKRAAEIKECLRRNALCEEVDRVVLLTEGDYSADWKNMAESKKITQVIIGKRLTYAHFLQFVKDEVPLNVFCILCNADIYMGPSLRNLWKMNLTDRMLALLRWDVPEHGDPVLFGPRADSQDTWILLSDSVKEKTWSYARFDFPLGKAGCDNAFAAHMLRNRFALLNPALILQTYHLHQSNVRDYSVKDMIRSDLYINLVPTYLIDMKQEQVPQKPAEHLCNELVSFEIQSSSLSNEITYCTMLEKEGRYKWEPSVENHYFEPAIPVYSWKKACVTPNGMVYEPYLIYTGKHAEEERFNYWKHTKTDLLTPLHRVQTMLAIPFPTNEVFESLDTYVLQYLSRAFRLLASHPMASLWIPKDFLSIVQRFKGTKELSFVFYEENTACWAEEVVGLLPGPSMLELGREEVTELRERCPVWNSDATPKVATIVVDDILTEEMIIKKIKPFLEKKGWLVRVSTGSCYSFIMSSLVIVYQGIWSSLWALPKDACVLEFQQELALSGECQHLAHISDLRSWILLLSKGSIADVQDQIMKQIEKWFLKNEADI